MAEKNEREAVAQDLDLDEQQSDEVTGGAAVEELQLAASPSEQLAALKRLKNLNVTGIPNVP